MMENKENQNDGKKQKIIIGIIIGVVVLVLIGAGIAIASNQPTPIEQTTEEQSSSSTGDSNNNKANDNSDDKKAEEKQKDNTTSSSSADNTGSNSTSSISDEQKASISNSISSLHPALTAEEVDNKSYTEQDGDYTKVDDFWKYKNSGNTTVFVRNDGYSFKVNSKMSPTYTLDPHYKPNLEFATNASEAKHFSINVSNDWSEAQESVNSRKETLARNDGNNCSYTVNGYTVMYWYSAKAATDSFYASDVIYVWNEAKQFYMIIYCDSYSGEEAARSYTDLFEF